MVPPHGRHGKHPYGILDKLAAEGMELPHVAITGGFATEDQVYKLTDVGNGPSMFYIMRNIKWQGVE